MAHDANTLAKLQEHAALGRDIVFIGSAFGAPREYRIRAKHLAQAVRVNDAGRLEMLEGKHWVSTESCAIKAREPKRRSAKP